MTLRMALIGAGERGLAVAQTIHDMTQIELVGVADSSLVLAREVAQLTGAALHARAEELLNGSDAQALYIATPPYTHVALARMAASHGLHVLVEKPPALWLSEFLSLVDFSRRYNTLLTVCLPAFTDSAAVEAATLCAAAGGMRHGVVVYDKERPSSYWTSGWTGRAETDWRLREDQVGGGVVLTRLIHELALLQVAAKDPVRRVYAALNSFPEGRVSAVLHHRSGAVSNVTATDGPASPGTSNGIRVLADGLTLQLNAAGLWSRGDAQSTWALVHSRRRSPLTMLLECFAAACAGDTENPVPPDSAAEILAVALAFYESSHTCLPVDISSVTR